MDSCWCTLTKRIWFVVILLLWVTMAFAQSPVQPVTVSGNIMDAGGNLATSGTVVFSIQPQSSGIYYYVQGQGALVPQNATCAIQSDGTLQNATSTGPCTVWGNDLITPANTTYTVTFLPNGTQTNSIPQQCIVGQSYSLNAPNFCPVVSIIPQYSMIAAPPINGNLIPQGNGLFTIGNGQAFYTNAYLNNLTFPLSWNGVLVATNGIISYSAALPGGPYCPLSGCTFNGQITLPSIPAPVGQQAITANFLTTTLGAYLKLTGGTLTGALTGTSGFFTGQMSANQYWINNGSVNIHQLGASDLTNGVSGSGAVCLAVGSACTQSAGITSVALTTATTSQLVITGSPLGTPGGTININANLLGSDTKLVTGATSGSNGQLAAWDANGGIGPYGQTDSYFTIASTCTPATSTDSNCTGTGTLLVTQPDTAYQVFTQVENTAGAFLYSVVTGLTTTTFSYTITCTFNCSTISTPSMFVHVHHN